MPALKKPTRQAVRPTGPRLYGLGTAPRRVGGPGEPPPGFVGATTSKSEWFVYWALAVVFNDPPADRLRTPPYYGGKDWGYQVAVDGGRRSKGGSVPDFFVYLPSDILILRLSTERFHYFAGPVKQAYDEFQRGGLERLGSVVDIYEQDILRGANGSGAVKAVKKAVGGQEKVNLVRSGLGRRVRI